MNSDDRDPPVPAPGEPDYLFTGEGPADADVARLESLLSPFAYRGPEGAGSDLIWAVAALVAGVSLLVYEGFFLKKLKHISYL